MSKLYELIRKDIEELKKFKENENNDFSKAKTFSEQYKEDILVNRVNELISIVSRKAIKVIGYEKLKNILEGYKDITKYGELRTIRYAFNYKLNPIIDYEKVFDIIEKDLKEEDIKAIEKDYEIKKEVFLPVKKPLTPYVDAIIKDMENDKKISQDEKDVYIKYLNYAKDNIVEKQKNIVEHTIDKVSVKRTANAVTKYKDWITKNGYDGIKYDAYNDEHERVISIENYTDVEGEMYKPFLNKKINYSDEFKNKIFNLKRFIDSKNILIEYQAGESGSKEYGFLDYFNQAIKVDKLIDNHMKLQTPEEKRANLVKISHEVKNLERIEKEYDEVLNYIKENFNVDDIALCGNIYSGRVYSFNNDLSKFRPNLPEKWDN